MGSFTDNDVTWQHFLWFIPYFIGVLSSRCCGLCGRLSVSSRDKKPVLCAEEETVFLLLWFWVSFTPGKETQILFLTDRKDDSLLVMSWKHGLLE